MNLRKYHFAFAALVVISLWTGVLAQSSGFDTSRMDRNADACNDFFQFANGTWVRNTEITPSQRRRFEFPFPTSCGVVYTLSGLFLGF